VCYLRECHPRVVCVLLNRLSRLPLKSFVCAIKEIAAQEFGVCFERVCHLIVVCVLSKRLSSKSFVCTTKQIVP
jgi:hypothetical protein